MLGFRRGPRLLDEQLSFAILLHEACGFLLNHLAQRFIDLFEAPVGRRLRRLDLFDALHDFLHFGKVEQHA